MLTKMWTRFAPARLAVVFLGNRLAGAVVQQDRVETFVVEAEDPAAAPRCAFLPRRAAGEGEPGAAGATRVLIAATDRRVLDTALRLAQDARLRPVPVTVPAHVLLALVRAPRGQRVVWAHVCGDAAELLLVQDGGLVLSRSVPLAAAGAPAAAGPRGLRPPPRG